MNEFDWMRWAACRGFGKDFYAERAMNVSKKTKELCSTCPVRKACLQYALSRPETHGFWGGKSERERRKIRKQQQKEAA